MTELNYFESKRFGNRVCYGYKRGEDGLVFVNEEAAETVKKIFAMAMSGYSLQNIQTSLSESNIKSPSGRDKWTRDVIDKTIRNIKYVPYIVTIDEFSRANLDKAERCRNPRN